MSTTKQEQEALPLKIKKPSLKRDNDQVYKLDMNKKPEEKEEENAVPEQSAGSLDEDKQTTDVEKVEERAPEPSIEPVAEEKEEEVNPLEEITPEENKEEVVQEVVQEHKEETPTRKLPENIEALISFMEETGGTIEDYARLNRDYSEYNEDAILNEYYKRTKPHLNQEEINFIMEDNFKIEEDVDDEREIKKKKLAYKKKLLKPKTFWKKQRVNTTKKSS